MIANTGGDRLFDWGGEFNTYLVPFSPYGLPTIHREPSPGAINFILALGKASGADQSRIEPDGELGLVRQKDDQWQDNHGGPRDANVRTGSRRDTQGTPESNTTSNNTRTITTSSQLLTTNDITKTVQGGNNHKIGLTTTDNNKKLSPVSQ